MSSIPTIPDPEKIKQTLARAHRNCQEMELAGIQLEEVVAKLDREIFIVIYHKSDISIYTESKIPL